MPPPTDQERQAFKRALQQSPAVLAAGGVLASGPKPGSATAAKDVRSQFPEQDLELDPAHQGSNSVFAASNLKLDNPEAVWRAQLPFGCADEASSENQLLQALFSQVEGRCIQFSTLKLFQWTATFIPHIHPQSTIQFEAKPPLTEIIEEMRAVTSLRTKTEDLNLDQSYLELNTLAKSSIHNRLTPMDAAVVDNVRGLIRFVGEGKVRVETYCGGNGGGNYDEVQKAFKRRSKGVQGHAIFRLRSPFRLYPGIQRR